MAENKDKKVLNVPNKRELTPNTFDSVEHKEVRLKRNVPNLRFKEFEGEWKENKLKNICTFYSGGTPTSSNNKYYGGNIPFIRSGELHKAKTELMITEEGYNNSSAKMVEKGDLLLAMYGATSGDIAISRIKGAINQAILCIKTNHNKKFLEAIWSKHVNRILKTYLQGGQGNLSADVVKQITFSIPTIQEQEKLAQLFFILDERIATQNKIIDKLESLIKGINHEIFKSTQGYKFKLGDIATISNGNSNVQDAITEFRKGLYPFFDRSDEIKYLPTFLFNKEAIIYPGEGTEFMPRYYNGKFALHQRCYAIFDFKEDVNPQYLYFLLKTQNTYFIKNAVGSTVPSLRIDTFQKLKVIIPSLKIQHNVSSFLSKLEQKVNIEKTILQMLLKQKQHLLRQMFI